MTIANEINALTRLISKNTEAPNTIEESLANLRKSFPFGKETLETVIVPEQEYTSEVEGYHGTFRVETDMPLSEEILDMDITVVFNGKEYTGKFGMYDNTVWLLDVNNNPIRFPTVKDPDRDYWIGLDTSTNVATILIAGLGYGFSETATIGVSTKTETITPLSPEFLPAGIGGGGDSPIIIDVTLDEADMTLSTDALHDDVFGSYLNGVNQFIRVKDTLGYPMQGFSLLQAISLVGSTRDIVRFGGFVFSEDRLLYVTIYVKEGALDDNGRAYVYMDPPMVITTTSMS